MTKRKDPVKGRRKLPRAVLPALLAAAVIAAALVPALLSAAPPALADGQALAMLPAGAEILARHQLRGGHVQRLEYRYTEEHPYCLVERTERADFRYEAGAWAPEGQPETLAETEDWSALAGTWTQQTGGAAGRALSLSVTGFDGGTLRGTAAYWDGTSSWEGPAEDVFTTGQKAAADRPYILQGTGFFRYDCLLVDRDEGVCFDGDISPMVKTALPALPRPADPSEADAALLAEVTAGSERTLFIVTAERDVYAFPDPDSEPLGTAAVGAVLACAGPLPDGWVQVEYDGVVGYMTEDDALLPLPEGGDVGVVTVWADVNVRTGPGQEYDLLDTAGAGTRLVYTGLEDGWYRVIDGGQSGYVAGEYVLPESLTPPEE